MSQNLRTAKWLYRPVKPALIRYSAAVALGSVAVLVQPWLEPLSGHVSYQVLLCAVALSALYGGTGNGLLTLLITGVAKVQFHVPAQLHEATRSPAAGVRLLLFLLIGAMVAWLAGELRTTQRKLAAALASISDAVAITDAHGRIAFLNPGAEALSGWKERDARRRTVEDVIRMTGNETIRTESLFATVCRERMPLDIGGYSLLRARDGTERPIEGTVAPIGDSTGRLVGTIAVFRDITMRRAIEEQLRRVQGIEAMGKLAGSVAHDFNNFLTVIVGRVEMLSGHLPVSLLPSVREDMNEILRASARAGQLSRQLMQFSRRQVVQPRLMDLNEVLSRLTRILQSLAGPRIELETRFDAKGQVRADPGQIEQVVLNLAINARDAMPDGGKLTIRTCDVALDRASPGELADLEPGAYVELEVSDTGCGMSENVRAKIFEPFFTTKPKGAGTGLGLSIVYGIVKQCGGGIEVSSQPLRGSRFRVCLPQCEEVLSAPGDGGHDAGGRAGAPAILVAEHDDSVRGLMCAVLEKEGFDVLEADNGPKAAHIAANGLDRISLIVADSDMPFTRHAELVERMALIRPGLRLLCVGDASKAADQTGGNVSFLPKPFTAAAFLAAVESLLGKRRQAA